MSLEEKLKKRQQQKGAIQKAGSKLREKLGLPVPFEDTVQYDGTLEGDTTAEVSAVLKGFKDRAKQEADRFKQATDTRFYSVLVFQTEEQKIAFLQAMEWLEFGDAFLDGLKIAKKQGVKLDKVALRNKDTVNREDKKLSPLVMED